jgi:hypothetical protein
MMPEAAMPRAQAAVMQGGIDPMNRQEFPAMVKCDRLDRK